MLFGYFACQTQLIGYDTFLGVFITCDIPRKIPPQGCHLYSKVKFINVLYVPFTICKISNEIYIDTVESISFFCLSTHVQFIDEFRASQIRRLREISAKHADTLKEDKLRYFIIIECNKM